MMLYVCKTLKHLKSDLVRKTSIYCFCHMMFEALPKLRHRAGGIFAAFPHLPLDKKERHSFYAQPVPVLTFFLATAQALELLTLFYLPGSVSKLHCGVCQLFNKSRL